MEGKRTLFDERWKGQELCSMEDGRDKNSVRCKMEGKRTLLDERWTGQELCSMKDGRDKNSVR